jgi:hypothetical protein
MTFHINDMMDTIGRKLMAGDVLELEHLKDYNALNQDVPAALKRYYVIADASLAAEGFTPTWWPHLWRVKINPLVDSQEYKDILNTIVEGTASTTTADIMSNYGVYMNINAAVLAQAEVDVPKSGYDTSKMYLRPEYQGVSADSSEVTADGNVIVTDTTVNAAEKIKGYLVGDGLAPNGLPLVAGIEFPTAASIGDYYLRTDYLPNRLFRYNGKRWAMIEDLLRANITPGSNNTVKSSFVNNTKTFTNLEGDVEPERQSLSQALRIQADN